VTANVFKGVFHNKIFCGIMVFTAAMQAVIVQFGGAPMHCIEGGLPASYWGLSLLLGSGALPVQQVINAVLFVAGKSKQRLRQKERYKRDRALVGKRTKVTPQLRKSRNDL
jgi:membrane protein implicated in regulation of membrane protease activity